MNLKEISSSADFYQLKEYTLTSKLIIFPFFLAFFIKFQLYYSIVLIILSIIPEFDFENTASLIKVVNQCNKQLKNYIQNYLNMKNG
jgi:hypothetical protein